jgi:aryl-alcohol dehydrogenase-like predicted oxidoreductase
LGGCDSDSEWKNADWMHYYYQAIIKTAFENGINMFDTAEDYQLGRSEEEM